MEYGRKKLGVIVGVEGSTSSVGMYHMSNDSEYLWRGDILNGVKVGAYLTINQNDVKIIASVANEKVIDQQNSIKSSEFDNRYSAESINRVIQLKTKGVIRNGHFQVTSRYVPMVGNEVTLTTKRELDAIYNIDDSVPTISIGHSLLEGQDIKLPIDPFFASHIGIFGNTGSGKSNTLHKLYLELFKSKYFKGIKKASQFFVIDFNGEYTSNQFGLKEEDKRIFKLNTRQNNNHNNSISERRIPVKKDYLFDADILSILFDAKQGVQVPFLRNAINLFNEKENNENFNFGNFILGTLKKILTSGDASKSDSLQEWIEVAKNFLDYDDEKDTYFNNLDKVEFYSGKNLYILKTGQNQYDFYNIGQNIEEIKERHLNLEFIANNLTYTYNHTNNLNKLNIFLKFEKIFKTVWGSIQKEYLDPLFSRIDSTFNSLSKVIIVKNNVEDEYRTMNIFSLANTDQETKRVIPMLVSKMFYNQQKRDIADNYVYQTKHLIIDEAHNILNRDAGNDDDNWQDYRLSVFEEIIKEGRKFGFYLTLASQRPADISPTILSQVHNYMIHRLVNDKDLQMLENTMPTLDRNSYDKLPLLGKGEAIITGNAISIPIIAKVDKETENRPDSDDVKLTELWDINKRYIQKDEDMNDRQ